MLVHLIALTKKTLIKTERYTVNTAKAEIMKKKTLKYGCQIMKR